MKGAAGRQREGHRRGRGSPDRDPFEHREETANVVDSPEASRSATSLESGSLPAVRDVGVCVVFDQEIFAQIRAHDFRIGGVPVPTRYGEDSSSISSGRSSVYAVGTLATVARYLPWRAGWRSQRLFRSASR